MYNRRASAMARALGSWQVLAGVSCLLTCAAAARGQQEAVYGPWEHPATNCVKDPLADTLVGQELESGDVICAPFDINALSIEVSAYLGTAVGPTGSNASIDLSFQIRDVADPSSIVIDVPLTLPADDWTLPRAWHSKAIDLPLVGTYWVCVVRNDAETDATITMMTEFEDGLEYQLRWDSGLGRYVERGGLWCSSGACSSAEADDNYLDPYIRIRQRVGLNLTPVVLGIIIEPNPAVPGSLVIFTGLATDPDGLGTITNSRLTYTLNDDPTLLTVNEVPKIINMGDHLEYTYVIPVPDSGTYRLFFEVQDASGLWSDSQVSQPAMLQVSDSSEDCPDPPPQDPPSMGPVVDQCDSPLCELVGLGTSATVVDPDGEETAITDEYSVCMNAPWSANPLARMRFLVKDPDGMIIREFNSHDVRPADNPGSERWYAEFDMTALPRPLPPSDTLTIVAIGCVTDNCMFVDNEEQPVESCDDLGQLEEHLPEGWEVWPCSQDEITVYAPPPWYDAAWVGLQEVTWHERNRIYQFEGMIPWNPNWFYPTTYFEQSIDFDEFGLSLKNAAGAKIDVDERFEPIDEKLAVASKSAEGGIEAWLLGFQIYDKPFDIEYDAAGDHYDVRYTSIELADYKKTLIDNMESATYYIPATSPVLVIQFFLTVDVGMKVILDLCSGIDNELKFRPVCLEPLIQPYIVFDASADLYWGIATLGMKAMPSITVGLPFCYDYEQDPQFYLDDANYDFDIDAQAYGCYGFGGVCKYSDWFNLFHKHWGGGGGEGGCPDRSSLSTPDERAAGPRFVNGGSPEPFPMPNPRIVSDGAGNAMAVWVHNDGQEGAASDIYYSYYSAASWSDPLPVSATNLVEMNPTVTFLDDGRALLVAVQNQSTENPPEGGIDAYMAQQELVYSIYDPLGGGGKGIWEAQPGQPYAKVYDDGDSPLGDGAPELSKQTSRPWVVWVRDPDGIFASDDPKAPEALDTDIWACPFSPLIDSFDPPVILQSGTQAFLEVDIAHDCAGNALAVWVRDEDGNGTTGNDRKIEASFYNVVTGLWEAPYTAIDSSSNPNLNLRGMLFPTVGFDATGLPVIAFTARTGPEGGLMPNGTDEYGEGTDDFLFTAYRPGQPAFSTNPFNVIDAVGGPYQHRARWPRMTISNNCDASPIAAVGTRWFKGAGYDGYDGEAAVFMKTLFGYPEQCLCDGDVDGNGKVEVPTDLVIIMACFDAPPVDECAGADVNCDGIIDKDDIDAFLCIAAGGDAETCCPMGPTQDDTNWGNPIRFSDDADLDWQVDVDIDPAAPGGSMLRALWVKPAGYDRDQNPTLPFGQGFDTIYLTEHPLMPDLSIQPSDICLSSLYAQQGAALTITASVKNNGTDIFIPVTVHFYLDSVSEENQIGSAVIPEMLTLVVEDVSIVWVGDGQQHSLIIVADKDNAITESDEENNQAEVSLIAVESPGGLVVMADAQLQRLVLTWAPPQSQDPAAPEFVTYRVYHDYGGDEQPIGDTIGTLYVIDTSYCEGTVAVRAINAKGAASLPAGPVQIPDSDEDGVGDHCEQACPTDLDGDGAVNAFDLAILLGSWGACPGCPADLDGDGDVDAADLAVLLGNWGPCE